MNHQWDAGQTTSGRLVLDHHVLEFLQGPHLDGGGGWLGFEHHFLLGEGIDAFACLDRRLAHRADLQQAGEDEFANRALVDVRFDDVRQAIQDPSHLLAAESGVFCDLIQDLSLGKLVFDGVQFLGHPGEFTNPDENVKTGDGKKHEEFLLTCGLRSK